MSRTPKTPEDWWSTAIVEMQPGTIRFRGYAIEELIGRVGFAEMVWLLTRGELPDRRKAELLEAALVAAVDHGPQAPSIAAARMAMTCGVGINNAMASAINMLGDVHGGAGEQCVALLQAIARRLDEAGASDGAAVKAAVAAEMTALAAAGVPDSLAGAKVYAENPSLISRSHFARHLVKTGRAPDVKSVFQSYLVKGKPGFVPHQWASLAQAVSWIRASGGIAVVAHPGRYNFSKPELHAFLAQFRDCGGAGIEVVTGSHSPEQYLEFARIAREFGLAASRGSDYHGKGESRADLGVLPQLPDDLKPVWHDW